MASVADALAGAQFFPLPARHAERSVLLAGAAGRLGERVLARLLGAPGYRDIHVLADTPMASTERKLRALSLSQWDFPVDDVVAVVSDEQSAAQAAALPVRGLRTQVYSSLAAESVLPLARRAQELGAKRLMVVTPLNVLGQPAALHARIATLAEAELARMDFESLILVRPTDHALRARRAGLPAKILGLLVDTMTGLLAGLRHTPMSLDDVARSSVEALAGREQGLLILEADELQRRLGKVPAKGSLR